MLRHVVVVGGGAAGWLTASILAADYQSASKTGSSNTGSSKAASSATGLKVSIIEPPDIPTIGVGEGTWPTMPETLRRIGLSEHQFIVECHASFKQGTWFRGWRDGTDRDAYGHPFTTPEGFGQINLDKAWQEHVQAIGAENIKEAPSFAEMFSVQTQVASKGLAPKQVTTPEYAAVVNYGYHLDAGKFTELLRRHAVENLGVNHIPDRVESVISGPEGEISAVCCPEYGEIEGDLFIDCSGFRSLLLAEHYQIPFVECAPSLLNDTALALHVSEPSDAEIASNTLSTAQSDGWVWDIGLPGRRGVGYVYSSAYADEDKARATLENYLKKYAGSGQYDLDSVKKIQFKSGYRQKAWHKNCVAIGMASGFIEPLEASALVMVELAAEHISRELPVVLSSMPLVAKRFNRQFVYRWERIIDFLKLHYLLSQRQDPYWLAARDQATISDRLCELLNLWQTHPPSREDFPQIREVFPAASYMYILYGMGFSTQHHPLPSRLNGASNLQERLHKMQLKQQKFLSGLPTNRELINHIHNQKH